MFGFGPETFLTTGTIFATLVSLLAAGLKSWRSKSVQLRRRKITIESPNGVTIDVSGATPEEVQQILAAIGQPPKPKAERAREES
jgi:hypothetical protein